MGKKITFLIVFLYFNQESIARKNLSTPALTVDDTVHSLFWRRMSDGDKCEPFNTFKIACNRCVCSADGVAYCTKMACIQNLFNRRRSGRPMKTQTTAMEVDFINNLNSEEN